MKLSRTLLIAAANEIETFYGLNMCKVWMAWKKSITNSEVYGNFNNGVGFLRAQQKLKIILIMQLLWVKVDDGLFIGKHEVQFYDGCADIEIIEFRASVS